MAQTKTGGGSTDKAAAGLDAKPQRKRLTRRKAVEEKVRSYYEAMANRDVGAMVAHWADDGVEDVVPIGVIRGPEELRGFLSELFAAMPDASTTITRLIAGEQDCAVEWRLEGTFDGAPFMGIEPTGSRVELREVSVVEVRDGEIVGITAYFDGASFARQIRMLPPDGSGVDRAMKGAFNTVTKLRRAVAERRNAG
ncbi:MAG TPA: ester cyclase [Thermoleophilaceae bacterium]